MGAPVALAHAVQHLYQPGGTLAAGRTLAARLVLEELIHLIGGLDRARRLIEHNHTGSAEHGAGGRHTLEVERGVELVTRQPGRRGAARNDDLWLAIAAHTAAVLRR